MGQKLGVPVPSEGFYPFLNLPREAIESLWLSYNLIGEGWALQVEDLQAIVQNASYLADKLGITPDHVYKLFIEMDTDSNDLVDALEVMSTLAIISGMDTIEKLHFVFSIFDFASTGELNPEAAALLVRSVVSGLNKVAVTLEVPSQEAVDKAAELMIASGASPTSLTITEYQKYCTSDLIMTSWIRYYSCVEPTRIQADIADKDISTMPTVAEIAPTSVASAAKITAQSNGPVLTNKIRSWYKEVKKSEPEEIPPSRDDLPEDRLDLAWVHGYGSVCGDGSKNNVRYGVNGDILFFTSNVGVSMSKQLDEEGGGSTWTQKFITPHLSAITAINTNKDTTLCATVDSTSDGSPATVHVWDTATNKVKLSILVSKFTYIRFLDFSADSKYLLVLAGDEKGSILMYSLSTGALVFETAVGEKTPEVIFLNSSSILACAMSTGVDFFIDENTGYMSETASPIFERRLGLYQQVGAKANGVQTTALSKFEKADECISGNAKGQLLFWHGKNCVQLLETHTEAISSIHFNASCGVVASGGADGVVTLYSLAPRSSQSDGMVYAYPPAEFPVPDVEYHFNNKGGPKLLNERQLSVIGRMDLLAAGAIAPAVRSVCMWSNGEKVLVSSKSGEIYELSAKQSGSPPPEPTFDEEGNEVPVEVDPEAPPYIKVGDDLNGGAVVTSHWSSLPDEQGKQSPASILCVAKCPGGFVTGATDGTLRQWTCADGQPNKCVKQVNFDAPIANIAVAASGTAVCVGFGAGCGLATRKGTCQVLSFPDLAVVGELTDHGDAMVNAIQFNAEGNTLVVGSADTNIYFYTMSTTSEPSAEEGGEPTEKVSWSLKQTLTAAQSSIEAIDLASDGLYLRSFEVSGAITVWDANLATPEEGQESKFGTVVDVVQAPPDEEGNPGPRSDPLRGITYLTSTVPSWDVKGMWLGLPMSDYLYSVDKFGALAISANSANKGSLAMNRYPAPEQSATAYMASHVGEIAACCFLDEGLRIVTVGKEDGTIKIYKTTFDAEEREVEEPDPVGDEAPPEVDPDAPVPDPLEYDSADDEDLFDGSGLYRIASMVRTKIRSFAEDKKSEEDTLAESAADGSTVTEAPPANPDAAPAPDATTEDAPAEGGAEDAPAEGGAEDAPAVEGAEAAAAAVEALNAAVTADAEASAGDDDGMVESVEPQLQSVDTEEVYDLSPFAVIKPWLKNYDMTASDLDELPIPTIPADDAEMDWVYGYSARSTRGSVKYSADGKIVYPASTIGVIYDKIPHKQTYFTGHSDTITALEYSEAKDIFASAQREKVIKGVGNTLVCVWNLTSTLQRINVGPVTAVSALAFSSCGNFLSVTCLDNNHTVKIYEWKSGTLRGSVPCGELKSLCIAFSLDNNVNGFRLLEGGLGHFNLLDCSSSDYISLKKGMFGLPKFPNVLCAVALPLPTEGGNEFLMGLSNGTLGVLARGERKISNAPALGFKIVTALHVMKLKDATAEEPPVYKVIAAGDHGLIKVLDSEFGPLLEFSIHKSIETMSLMGNVRGIKSVCVDHLQRKILFGTSGGEIGELDVNTGRTINEEGILVNAHCRDQTHAMDIHPIHSQAITGGDDKTLRIWDLENKKQLTMIQLNDVIRSVSFSPNGQLVVAGLGGSIRRKGEWKDRVSPPKEPGDDITDVSTLVVLSYLQEKLTVVFETNDASAGITSSLFAPDQKRLYVGSRDKRVCVYDPLSDFHLVDTYEGGVEEIRSMDLTGDGQYLVVQGVDSEVVLYDISTAKKVTGDKKVNCLKSLNTSGGRKNTYGLDSLGVHSSIAPFDDVRCVNKSANERLLASGHADGSVRLYAYPSTRPSAPYKEFLGHSQEGVSSVLFSFEDDSLLSLGRDDRTLIQWKIKPNLIRAHTKAAIKLPAVAEANDDDDIELPVETNASKVAVAQGKGLEMVKCMGLSMAGTISAGYCGVGSMIVLGGASPIMIDINGNHSTLSGGTYGKPITCSAVSYDGKYILLGEGIPSKAEGVDKQTFVGGLTIKNAITSSTICTLSTRARVSGIIEADGFVGGIAAVTFDKSGTKAACVTGDIYSSLHVFSTNTGLWDDATCIFSGPVDTKQVKFVSFVEDSADYQIMTCGEDAGSGGIKFWNIRGKNASCVDAEFAVRPAAVTALSATNSLYTCTGHMDGSIFMWEGNTISEAKVLGKHTGPVGALTYVGADWLISGSTDSIKIFEKISREETRKDDNDADVTVTVVEWAVKKEIATADIIKSIGRNYESYGAPNVTSISSDKYCKRLLISLSSNVLVEVSVSSEAASVITEGLKKTEDVVLSIAHPTEEFTVLSLSKEEGVVKIWDLFFSSSLNVASTTPTLVEVLTVPHKPTAACFKKDGSTLYLGMTSSDANGRSGKIMVVSYDTSRSNKRFDKASVNSLSTANISTKSDNAILSVTKAIHDVGEGDIDMLKFSSDDDQRVLLASNEDRKIYFFDNTDDLNPLGFIDCRMYFEDFVTDDMKTTLFFDFSTSGKQIRCMSGFNEDAMTVRYYDITVPDADTGRAATNITSDIESSWDSVSTINNGLGDAFTNARDGAFFNADITSIFQDNATKHYAVCYKDGSFRIGEDVYCCHSPGPNLQVLFLAGGKYVVSTSSTDGTMILHRVVERSQ